MRNESVIKYCNKIKFTDICKRHYGDYDYDFDFLPIGS